MCQPGTYTDLLQSIKRTLDPNNILAPGRYVPECAGEAGLRSHRRSA
jgi:hypothetical protein